MNLKNTIKSNYTENHHLVSLIKQYELVFKFERLNIFDKQVIVLRKLYYWNEKEEISPNVKTLWSLILNNPISLLLPVSDYTKMLIPSFRKKQELIINNQQVDIGHIFTGIEAHLFKPIISKLGIPILSNPAFFVTFIGDIGKVYEKCMENNFFNINSEKAIVMDVIDVCFGDFEIDTSVSHPLRECSIADMRGNIDSFALLNLLLKNRNKGILEHLVDYYLLKKMDRFRFDFFCKYLGLGEIKTIPYYDSIKYEGFSNEAIVIEKLTSELFVAVQLLLLPTKHNNSSISRPNCKLIIELFIEKLRNAFLHEHFKNKKNYESKNFYYLVRKNDNLPDISKRFYNDEKYWLEIWNINKSNISSKNSMLISSGDIIEIPQ